jgi:hypothetical protein
LWSAGLKTSYKPFFHYSGFEPFIYGSPYHSITHPLLKKASQMTVVQSIKELLDIQFKHMASTRLHQLLP